MNLPTRCACAFMFALSFWSHGAEKGSDAEKSSPFRQLKMKVPGKVDHVTLCVGNGKDTGSAVDFSGPTVRQGQPQPKFPETQVWLLKADGTVILPSYADKGLSVISMAGGETAHRSYAFDYAKAKEAVALAASIDGEFFIENVTGKFK